MVTKPLFCIEMVPPVVLFCTRCIEKVGLPAPVAVIFIVPAIGTFISPTELIDVLPPALFV